jgi:hypothetical protein
MDGQAAVEKSIEHSLSVGFNLKMISKKNLKYSKAKKLYILKVKTYRLKTLFHCVPVCPSVCLPICLSVHCLFIHSTYLPICLSAHLFVCPSVCLTIGLSAQLSSVCLSTASSFILHFCPSVCQLICLSAHLSVSPLPLHS